MKPKKINAEILLLKQKAIDKINLMGVKNASLITGIHANSIWRFCTGTLIYSSDKILEICEKLDIK